MAESEARSGRAPAERWCRKVRHDLLKRALWTARDLEALGPPFAAEDVRLAAAAFSGLADAEGRPIEAPALWQRLRDAAPPEVPPDLLAALDGALAAAWAALAALREPAGLPAALAALLALERVLDAA